jgi:hypothetical protein
MVYPSEGSLGWRQHRQANVHYSKSFGTANQSKQCSLVSEQRLGFFLVAPTVSNHSIWFRMPKMPSTPM